MQPARFAQRCDAEAGPKSKIGVVGAAALAAALLVSLAPGVAAASPPPTTPIVSAHRGGAGEAPGNSMLAFRRALAANYDEIEADAYVLNDRGLVIFHDARINPAKCSGPYGGRNIWELTSRQVSRIRCDGQPIPSERELVELIARSLNNHTVLRLEVKHGDRNESHDHARWADWMVSRMIVRARIVDRTIMQDFVWSAFPGVRRASRQLRVSALIAGKPTLADIRRARAARAYDLSYPGRYATTVLNRSIARHDLVPTVWGVDSVPPVLTGRISPAVRASFCAALRAGAQVIITNYPASDRYARDHDRCR